MVTTVLSTTHKQLYNELRLRGRATSNVSWSAEKRLMMRPWGVESKNDTGARNRLCSILLCKALEAFSSAKAKTVSRTQRRTPDAATRIPNMVM